MKLAKNSRALRIVFTSLAVLLLVMLAAFAIFVLTFDANQHKSRIESMVEQSLGRKVALRGDLYIGTSLIPTVVARDIHIADADWTAMEDITVIDTLSFSLELLPLILEKRVVVYGVELDGVRLNLEKNQAGDNNWTFGEQHSASHAEGLSSIQDIVLENVSIVYRSPGGYEQTFTIAYAEVELDGGLKSLEITASYRDETVVASLQRKANAPGSDAVHEHVYQTQINYRDAAITASTGFAMQDAMSVDVADINVQFRNKEQMPMQVNSGHLRWGMEDNLVLSLDGAYGDIPVAVAGTAGSVRTMFDAINYPIKVSLTSNENIVEVEGELSEKLTNPDIKVQTARINNSDFKGRLIFDRSEDLLVIRGQLQSNKFSLDDIERLPIFTTDQEVDAEARQFKLPETFALDLELKANEVDGLAVDVRALQAKVSLQQGALKISGVRLKALSTDISGGVDLTNSARGVDYALHLKSPELDVQKVLRGHKVQGQAVSGAMQTASLNMKGPVVSMDQLLSQSSIDLQAGQSKLLLHGPEKTAAEPLQLDQLKLFSMPGKSTQVSLQGLFRDNPFGFDLQTADYNALQKSSASLPVKLTATFADHSLKAEGKMGDMQLGQGLHVAVDIKGDNLQTAGQFLKIELPEIGPYELIGRLDATDDEFKFTGIKGKLGKSDVTGMFKINMAQQRPTIVADVNAKVFHYYDIFAQQERKEDDRLVPDVEVPVEFLKSFDAVVDINAEKLFVGEVEYDDFILHATLKDGYLQVEPFDSRLAGAFVDGALHIDTRQEKPTTRFTLNSKNTDYGGLLESFGWTNKVEGLGDVEINLQGSGLTLREALANSTGDIQLVAGKGIIKEPKFDLWAAGLVNTMLTSAWETKESASVQCIVGRFDIKDGTVTSDTLMLDTTEITVAGTASIDLKTEKIDALIQPAPKNPSFISMANPVKLTGSMLSPDVSIEQTLGRRWGLKGFLLGLANPMTLLVMYSDLGTGVQNPCLEAVQKREAKEEAAEKDGTEDSLKLPGGNILKKLLPGDD